ncbi:glutathione S-transferase family protein [Piscinibacterium candidicorallinum]|uniref:Glutathione S-transferase family protein n=1 Tax=Piscinibacterium candidicorallinum TaxID=1793872 RepID=A0ABV7H633_9BURK
MLKLVIADKAYSSWSLRPWLALTQAGIPFEEVRLRFGSPTYKQDFREQSPTGKVPVLVLEDGQRVWDSLAIIETAAELFPDKGLWPANPGNRAHARSICAEMHAGFMQLRSNMPMHLLAKFPGRGWNLAVQADIDRVEAIWRECLQKSGGPFLFGNFTAADAFFAPVVTRLDTYVAQVAPDTRAYMDRVFATEGMQTWIRRAREEFEFVDFEEPYRRSVHG